MKRVIWIAGLLTVLIVVLVPMAWASPIDPTWTKGVYDDADFDDVVTYLTSFLIAAPVIPIEDLLPTLPLHAQTRSSTTTLPRPSRLPSIHLALRLCTSPLAPRLHIRTFEHHAHRVP
jgi:hypothetical protein